MNAADFYWSTVIIQCAQTADRGPRGRRYAPVQSIPFSIGCPTMAKVLTTTHDCEIPNTWAGEMPYQILLLTHKRNNVNAHVNEQMKTTENERDASLSTFLQRMHSQPRLFVVIYKFAINSFTYDPIRWRKRCETYKCICPIRAFSYDPNQSPDWFR